MKATWKWAAVLAIASATACDVKKAPPAPPPPTVYVKSVVKKDVPLYVEAIGTLDGYDNADIRARVKGYLKAQSYKDGAAVKTGQTLFTIESTEYVAAADTARAAVTRAKVNQAHNKVTLDRDQGLLKAGIISQQEVDNATANLADSEGQIQSAAAQLRQAELNLSYTRILSPLDGVAGIALVRIGNLVGQDGPTLLTTVSSTDPIRVNFPMGEVDYVKYPDRFKHLDARDLAWAKKQFVSLAAAGAAEGDDPGIELVLSDGSLYARRGVVIAYNRQVDPTTGTIQVQGLFPNPDQLLRPGEYARVRIRRQEAGKDVLVVPEKALISVQGTYSLGVVGPDDKVALRKVEIGPSSQGQVIVKTGVAEGDRIVVEGMQKISDGSQVVAKAAPETPNAASSAASASAAAPKN